MDDVILWLVSAGTPGVFMPKFGHDIGTCPIICLRHNSVSFIDIKWQSMTKLVKMNKTTMFHMLCVISGCYSSSVPTKKSSPIQLVLVVAGNSPCFLLLILQMFPVCLLFTLSIEKDLANKLGKSWRYL